MKNNQLLVFGVLFFCGMTRVFGQTTPIIEIQGEGEISPYEGQTVTISGKVTEFFGDSWYIQDGYGAWNGVYVAGPDVVIPANPPYWNVDRSPEVGDVLELTGTVEEDNGNTQLVEVELTNFIDFWNATPIGVWLMASEFQDEQFEGTRVRVDNATVVAEPDADGMWTVTDGTATITCWGVDVDDPGGNEDPDGPTTGDVYQVYGAMHQMGEIYVLHVGDIDVLSLAIDETGTSLPMPYPNPATDVLQMRFPASMTHWRLMDVTGSAVLHGVNQGIYTLNVIDLSRGSYRIVWGDKDGLQSAAIVLY